MKAAGRGAVALGIVLALVFSALLGVFWIGGGATSDHEDDPRSSAPSGASALSRMLQERGQIEVRVAPTASEIGDTGGSTLVVSSSKRLSTDVEATIRTAISRSARVIFIAPTPRTTFSLVENVNHVDTPLRGMLTALCTTPEIEPSFEISGRAQSYVLKNPGAAGKETGLCFRQSGGGQDLPAVLVSTPNYGGVRQVILGNREMLSNAQIRNLDHAAVAMRIFGAHKKVVWYTGEDSLAAKSNGSTPLWPPYWLGPLTLGLAGTVVALMLWRGRRLGRLAVEPLPVIVRANETTLARGRLYRRAKDPGHAAHVLQTACCRRLAAGLGLSPTSSVDTVAAAAAQASGWPGEQVYRELTRRPADNADLTALARALTALEREVRRP